MRNFTVAEVAGYLGVSITYYRDLEKGRRKPSANVLARLAVLYNIPTCGVPVRENLILNINSGAGSNSNSGHIKTYVNNAESVNTVTRLIEIEKMLKQILLSLR